MRLKVVVAECGNQHRKPVVIGPPGGETWLSAQFKPECLCENWQQSTSQIVPRTMVDVVTDGRTNPSPSPPDEARRAGKTWHSPGCMDILTWLRITRWSCGGSLRRCESSQKSRGFGCQRIRPRSSEVSRSGSRIGGGTDGRTRNARKMRIFCYRGTLGSGHETFQCQMDVDEGSQPGLA
jgi:hypothetical protein